MEQLIHANANAGVIVPGMNPGPCQETWNEGVRHYVNGWWRTPDGWKFVTRFFPVFVKKNPDTRKSFNCHVITEGGQHVLATLPGRDALDAYLKSIPIENDLPLEDGVYTWIFYHRGASPVQFAATRSWSALEMGTIHLAIAARVGARAVHGAGELKKEGDTYTYNLLSGTFTAEWKKKMKGVCTGDMLETYIDDEFKNRFSSATLTKTDTTLIGTVVTQEEIDIYTNAGWTFRFFPTEKECISAMNAKGGRRRTRRGGNLSDPQRILRNKQIKEVQHARERKILQLVGTVTQPRNRTRPGWHRPSEAKQEHLSDLLHENDRLTAMGKGRRITRRR